MIDWIALIIKQASTLINIIIFIFIFGENPMMRQVVNKVAYFSSANKVV